MIHTGLWVIAVTTLVCVGVIGDEYPVVGVVLGVCAVATAYLSGRAKKYRI